MTYNYFYIITRLCVVLIIILTVTKQSDPLIILNFGTCIIYFSLPPNNMNNSNICFIVLTDLFVSDSINDALVTPYLYELWNYSALFLNKSTKQYKFITHPILQNPHYFNSQNYLQWIQNFFLLIVRTIKCWSISYMLPLYPNPKPTTNVKYNTVYRKYRVFELLLSNGAIGEYQNFLNS